MFRKAIMVVISLGLVAAATLWVASYWMKVRWQFGDGMLVENRQRVTIAFVDGTMRIWAHRREASWKLIGFPSSDCSRFSYPGYPSSEFIPGVRYELFPERLVRSLSTQERLLQRAKQGMDLVPPREADLDFGTNGAWNPFYATQDEVGDPAGVPVVFKTAASHILVLWISMWHPLILLSFYPCFSITRTQLRRIRRRRRGCCIHCGYNLTGLPKPICPECGTRIESLEAERAE